MNQHCVGTKVQNGVKSGMSFDLSDLTTLTETDNDSIHKRSSKACRTRWSDPWSIQSGNESDASSQVIKLSYELAVRDKIKKEREIQAEKERSNKVNLWAGSAK